MGSPLSFPVVPVCDLPLELWNKNVVHQASMPPGQTFGCRCGYLHSNLRTSTREIPLTARRVCTLLSASAWHMMLRDHPNTHLVQLVLHRICQGFRMGFTKLPQSLKSARKNLNGALQLPAVVSDYLSTELALGRMVGPFPPWTVPCVHISLFGVIPKGRTGKWRLIVDLSHLKGHSVNDGIPKALCSLKYITIDEAIKSIIQYGKGALAKINIKSAFHLIPVHHEDRGMQWNGGVRYRFNATSHSYASARDPARTFEEFYSNVFSRTRASVNRALD